MLKKIMATLWVGIVLGSTSGCGNEEWDEGEKYGQWRLAFDGHGKVEGSDAEVMMVPTPAEHQELTHACLVYTDDKYEENVDFEITVNTKEQVRVGEPNPWEVGWVLWNYQSNDQFYALALKPNGWELSKQDEAYPGKQRFLVSGQQPTFAIQQDHRVRVVHAGNTMKFFANGVQLGEFKDEERPYIGGSIALYTEDARVEFRDLQIHSKQ